MDRYEVVIIGAGPGGYQAALELGNAGKKVLLIDKAKKNIGGVCLNVGCIPTKNYLHNAEFISKIEHFMDSGVNLQYEGLNLGRLQTKTTALIDEIRSGVVWMLDQNSVELLYGEVTFLDQQTIKVDNTIIEFDKCIVATGSKPRELEFLPFDGKQIISSNELFTLEALPKSITIVGSGAIGCEAASFFNAFGVKVTLLSRGEMILSKEDIDVAKALKRVFKRGGIELIDSASIKSVNKFTEGVELTIESGNEEQVLKSDVVLSVSGRIPNTSELNLENAGIKLDTKGFIEINEAFQTTNSNIYAVGDCIDTPGLAHTAYKEGKITAYNIINSTSKANTHISPSTVYTNPQVATCGLKESDAQNKNIDIDVKKVYFKANAKAKILGDDSGFAKVIVSKEDRTILGAAIIGVEATEIIHELVFSVEKKLTIDELRDVIHAHPSVSEIISYL
ncbi:dihydrolipoyl dehydrogenase [Sulfurimonas marina]|uniref:Dihydrolipoyl dehydrogenase n=1 Tax=Sulfurimonas marina TaxID=2590551 RepID=A0A7M1AVB3_9BACT|nr:dihydrolipoyl dehydrogenase [Sulfurimonas marina]QOP41326.1 dihydrolipoyl dehydrogenase [Sulfurimonas marina]